MASVQPVSIDHAKCVLVIGATSCIGRALALAISQLPSRPTVIAAGRREDELAELEDKNLETLRIDVTADLQTLKTTLASLVIKYPHLDAVIFASGVYFVFSKNGWHCLKISTEVIKEIDVSYSSVVSVISILMPHFLKLSAVGHPSFIIPITSGLGSMPSPNPNYSASKAALRNRNLITALRAQLKNTKVNLLEIIPPLVESDLQHTYAVMERPSKIWMSFDEFVKKTIDGLRNGDLYVTPGTAPTVLKCVEKAGPNEPFPMNFN
ncbi:hypothetical protein B0H19DRAFT_944468 [Mycena capillaripes]|nr:hypothetical protein B0H19DRAFT_944468 [Mycena capillaripes]